MSISDFIVILSIIVTLVTVAVSNNKHLWLYKFDKKISTVLIIVAILIHYLIFFNKYFYHRGWYLKCFMYQNGIETNIWAYIVTIITLSVLIYYITKCRYFPKSNNDKIIRYYKSLINTNIAGLISNIDTYHKKDIDKYFEFVNKLPKENSKKDSNELIDEEQVNNKVKANLPRDIVHNILFNKNFIKHSLDIDPIYFLDKVYNVTSDCLINFSEVISFYFNYLIESKNTEFISELETISDDIIKNDKRFLPLIFNEKPNFISTVALDKVFGETAYKEICICNYIFNQKINEWFDNEYKKSSCYQFLQFFKCLHLFLIDRNIAFNKGGKTLFPEYMHILTNKIVGLYPNTIHDTYVEKFINDCINTLRYLIERCFKKERCNYLSMYIQELLKITKIHTDYITYNKDSLENVIKLYLSLESTYKTTECYNSFLNHLKSNKCKIDKGLVKEILENIGENDRTNAFYQIKKILL